MNHRRNQFRLGLAFLILILVQFACLPGSPDEPSQNSQGPDYAATEAALQKTQAALEDQAQQPEQPQPEEPKEPEPQPEPTNTSPPPPTTAPEPETYQSGDLIYYTDFDGPEDWEDGWIHFSWPDSDYTVYKDNGVMHIEVPETYTTVYLFYDNLFFEREYADVYVEAGFENLSTHNINNISIMCRATDQGWYEFSILSGGLWYIYRVDAQNGTYKIIKDGGIADLDYDAPHTIGADCIGNELTFYFDGDPLKNGSIRDTTYREGQIGFSVYAGKWADVVVEFDYFGVMLP